MPLVVLTYPGHFLLTALTIRSYLEYHSSTEVIVVADDLSSHAWPTYLNDCQNLYWAPVIPVSQISTAKQFNNGWIRQQIAKLYMDQVIDADTWFFTDGDVEYRCTAPVNSIPFTITRTGTLRPQQNAYVARLLGIDNAGIYTEHPDMDWEPGTRRHQVCVSNPPFRTMSAVTLQQLRQHIEQQGLSVADVHLTVDNLAVSEWELIANFQLHVLKQDIPLVYYPTVAIDSNQTSTVDYCATCYETDQAYSREWWQSKGITISDRIWQQVINIAK